ncbi:hypothetical protein PENANT_c061G02511 [Penicillium antarcticum]|uniref:Uncharacterized protein n=1 Tax=Penicillium antarcticum TaxID=416450 RepID=A0A1V6PRF7_9EURO|nr:hypothetical protein PENANT_c061G02511 [Penicillium antarcticum]
MAINAQPSSTISDSAQPTLRCADVARRNSKKKLAQRHGAERFLNEELPFLSNPSNQYPCRPSFVLALQFPAMPPRLRKVMNAFHMCLPVILDGGSRSQKKNTVA